MDITSLIARGIDPPADPVAAYTKLKQMVRGEEMSRLQLEEARRQNKLGQMGLEQHEQDRQDEQTWREALARHGGNTEAALTAAAGRVGAKSWFGLQQQLIKAQQERATTAKTEAETAKMEADFFGLLAYGVKAAEAAGGNKLDAFGAALDTAGRAYPIHRERVASLAKRIAQYPGELDTLLDTMIAHSPAAQELAIKQRQETRAQATEKRAAELHPLQVSKSTADAQLAGINAGAGAVGRITDQASLDAFLDANPAYRKLGLTEYKPDIVQFFRRAAISPHEQNMEAIASRNAENNVSESELQLRAAKGDLVARAALDRARGANVTDLKRFVDTSSFLAPGSDIVSLMVLEHDTRMSNLLTRVGYEVRMALHDQVPLNEMEGVEPNRMRESTQRRIRNAAEELLKYLVFVDEAPLEAPVEGSAEFVKDFAAQGRRDSLGRSLRDFDLQRRLFRYPCSYQIYSTAFDALPGPVKDQIYRRLWEIVTGQDKSPEFASLTAADRRAVFEILRETKKGLPEYWAVR